MKVPRGTTAASTNSLAAPAFIVVLILVLGATIFLWRARYIRRRTAYVVIPILVAAIAILGVWMYLYPT